MKMKVMVAIDESDGSLYALKWALDNLFNIMTTNTMEGTSSENEGMVFLVHVEPNFHTYAYPIPMGPAGIGYYFYYGPLFTCRVEPPNS